MKDIKDILINNKRFILVRTPGAARSFILIGSKLHFYNPEGPGTGKANIKLPIGQFKIVGLRDSITDEEWKQIIPITDGKNFITDKYPKEYAFRIFESVGVYKWNIYGDHRPTTIMFHKGQEKFAEQVITSYHRKWEHFNDKVYNPLILIEQ